MTLQLRCVRIFSLQPSLHYAEERRDAGGRRCRKNNFSSEFSGCLVWSWPLHYSYVGWSLITCRAATALKQLFYWPSSPLSFSISLLSSPLLSQCLPSLRCYFTPVKSVHSDLHHNTVTLQWQDTYSKQNTQIQKNFQFFHSTRRTRRVNTMIQ